LKRLDEERRKEEREVISAARDKRWWKDGSRFLAGPDLIFRGGAAGVSHQ
jgi:hypothetical protein